MEFCRAQRNTFAQDQEVSQVAGELYDGLNKRRHVLYRRKKESSQHYTPYSARMSPENTHKLMGFYMEVLVLGIIL